MDGGEDKQPDSEGKFSIITSICLNKNMVDYQRHTYTKFLYKNIK